MVITAIVTGLTALLAIVLPWVKQGSTQVAKHVFVRFLSLLCLILVLFFIFNQVATGAHYPSGRKSIILFPPFAMLVFFLIKRIPLATWRIFMQWSVVVVLVFHLVITYDSKTYREWWYDAETKDMIGYVAKGSEHDEPVALGVEWIFHPSSLYYIETREFNVDLHPYSKDILPDLPVDYYYVTPEHISGLSRDFETDSIFGHWVLLRRRGR
jgi:hypothetical protein